MVPRDRSHTGRVSRSAVVIVIPLGEADKETVRAALRRHFPNEAVTWLDRAELRRRPLTALLRLASEQHDTAVLVAPDLRQSRLRLTSLALALPRAHRRWRIDLLGNRESFTLIRHLAQHGLPIVRHLLACGLALVAGEPLLQLVDAFIKPRQQLLGRPTRILYLRSQLWLGLEGGGSVAHTAGVIGGLEDAGVQVQVVSSDRLPGVMAPTGIVRPETWFDGWLREAEDLAYNVAFFGAALRAARRLRPRAIYQRHTAFNISGALLSRLLRLPLVLEFNSSELWKGRYWGGLRLTRPAALVERINLRAADRVIVVSEVLKMQVLAAGVAAEKVVVNPNGVDPAHFRPDVDAAAVRKRLGLDGAVVVGFSGTFGRWHGIPTLAEALGAVLQSRPDVRWLLIGDGPLRHLVDNAIQTHGLDGRVRLPGLVPHAEMPAYLAACDVLVSPHGRQADGGEFFGSPTKLFEYMATGRPIVASRVGQIADVLQDGESALLVPPDDAHALCDAILRLVDDACLRSRLGEAARRAAVECHTWRQNAERVLGALGARS
jgi:glycosyltransferase involved in cell wall biosynthesis